MGARSSPEALGQTRVTHQGVRDALVAVVDPELGYSIVDLGLLRRIELEDGGRRVQVALTLTSPMCPVGPEILAAAHQALSALAEVDEVQLELVWSPPWSPADATEEIQAEFGMW